MQLPSPLGQSPSLPQSPPSAGTSFWPSVVGEIGVTDRSYVPGDVRRHGAKVNGTADDATPWRNAVASCATHGGPVIVPTLPSGFGLLGSTVDLASNVSLRGTWGGPVELTVNPRNGSFARWIGAINSAMLRLFGVQFTSIDGLSLDGAAIAGVTGILVDSVNNPATRNVAIRNVSIVSCGEPNTPTGSGLTVGTSSVSDYQNDRFMLENFHIQGCGYGIHLDSANALSVSTIADGAIQDANRGIFLEDCGPLTMRSVAFGGSTLGPDPAYLWIEAQNPITIQNCQGEGGTGHFIVVSGPPNTAQTLTLIQNVSNRPVDIRSARTILSMGNFYSDDFVLSGNGSIVISIGDTFTPGKDFVVTGTGCQVIRLTPSTVSPFMEFKSNIEGDILKLTAGGSGANPALRLKNAAAGGGDWQILFPGTGGLLPGGFVLRNVTAGTDPIYVDPGAPEGALHITAATTTVGNILVAASELLAQGVLSHTGTQVGFFNATPAAKPTVTGSKGANAALGSLLTALATLGLINDSST